MGLILLNYSRRCQLYQTAVLGAIAVASSALVGTARGATIERISKDQTKLQLLLSPAELAAVEDGQDVLIEVDKPRFVISGTLSHLNVLKKTVVLEMEEEDERLALKQRLRFLPAFNDYGGSPLLRSLAQYHQFQAPFLEASGGGFFEGQKDKISGGGGSPLVSTEKTSQSASGSRLTTRGYLPLSMQWLGVGFDYERRDAEANFASPATSTSMTLTYNRISPALWIGLVEHEWRLGLRYDYTDISQVYRGDGAGTFSYSLGQVGVSLVHYTSDEEAGLDFTSADNLAQTAYNAAPGQTVATADTIIYKAPAELYVFFRKVTSPLFIWGMGVGYIFFDPSNGSAPADPSPSPEQVLRFKATFESRLDDGSKMDWIIRYDGGHAKALSSLEQDANELGIDFSYQTAVTDRLVLGVEASVGAGLAVVTDQLSGASGNVSVQRQITGYRASVLGFANYAFNTVKKSKR